MDKRRENRVGGFTLVELMITVAVIAIILSLAIPSLAAARRSGNETSALGSFRALGAAHWAFAARFQRRPVNPGELMSFGYIDNFDVLNFAQVGKHGYVFSYFEGVGDNFRWAYQAVPSEPSTGTRSYWMDEKGVIRYSDVGPATWTSPSL